MRRSFSSLHGETSAARENKIRKRLAFSGCKYSVRADRAGHLRSRGVPCKENARLRIRVPKTEPQDSKRSRIHPGTHPWVCFPITLPNSQSVGATEEIRQTAWGSSAYNTVRNGSNVSCAAVLRSAERRARIACAAKAKTTFADRIVRWGPHFSSDVLLLHWPYSDWPFGSLVRSQANGHILRRGTNADCGKWPS